jgi:cytochrome c peroxidase
MGDFYFANVGIAIRGGFANNTTRFGSSTTTGSARTSRTTSRSATTQPGEGGMRATGAGARRALPPCHDRAVRAYGNDMSAATGRSTVPFVHAALAGAVVAAALSGGGCSSEASSTSPLDAGTVDAAPSACDPTRAAPADVAPFEIGNALPEVSFTALDASGSRADFSLHSRFAPCREEPQFLVLRIGATWCEPCRVLAKTTAKWRPEALRGSVEVVDVLLADNEQQVPSLADLAAWRAGSDADLVASTAERRWFGLDTAPNHMPYSIVIDRRSMHALLLGHGWGWQEYPQRIGALFARYKRPNPWGTFVPPPLKDGLFDESEWEVIQGMALQGEPPADPTNRVFTSAPAAALGRRVFFDGGFSANGGIACAKCHDPAKNFGDDVPQSVGLARVDRHSPNIALAAFARAQFWDGRADSLWMQALGPFENPKEMGFTRGGVVRRIAASYRAEYEALFGALPAIATSARLDGLTPSDAGWSALSATEQDDVNRVYANVGKAIAAYERTLRVKESRFDRYARGDLAALTEPERKGLKNYLHGGCAQCHAGPRLTDGAFHVLRFPTGRRDGVADRGRITGLTLLELSEFNAAGAYSDAPVPLALPAKRDVLVGAFKTPTLRGIASRGHFGHGGTVATLEDLVKHYGERGLADTDPKAAGTVPEWVPKFDTTMQRDLLPFLRVLTGDAVDPAAASAP